ncbi:BTB [Trichuris trichiura]|uniref:BTB n=1 Tax=Trichuris trichiura TaxID=36087 RepID=A0A077YV88_TRITR|nr:BTB [Trichuris trichiura]
MSFESAAERDYWSSWRALVLHSLGGNYSFSCKVQLDIVYTSHEGERLNNTLEKFIHVNNTGEDTQIARVILPPLEEYIDNNGALTFLCTITTFGQAFTLRENASINTNSEAFVNSFKRILEAKTGTDLDTVPSDCVITAQKSIFFVRSPKIDTTIQMAKESNLHNDVKKIENRPTCNETSRTTIKYTKVQHRWVIENFHEQESLQKLKSVPIQSAEFASPDKRHKFKLVLQNPEMFGNINEQTSRQAKRSLLLHTLTDSEVLTCKVQFNIAYTNGSQESMQPLHGAIIHLKKPRAVGEIAGVTLPQNLDSIVDNDVLTVACIITIYDEISTVCDRASPSDKENGKAFVSSFEKFLKAKTATDMDVIASDCVITAHKSILLARSPVMLSLIEEGRNRSILNATQFSCQAMHCMISYIYTDKCSIKSDIAEEVMQAAHEYKMPNLERIAEKELIGTLDEKNIVSRVKLAKVVGPTVLSQVLSNYIIKNRHVLSSDDWKKMERDDPSASAFILKEAIVQL